MSSSCFLICAMRSNCSRCSRSSADSRASSSACRAVSRFAVGPVPGVERGRWRITLGICVMVSSMLRDLWGKGGGILTAKHMRKGATGQKRGGEIKHTVHRVLVATAYDMETLTKDGKNAAAVALGRKGGAARARTMPKAKRVAAAKKAAAARWNR